MAEAGTLHDAFIDELRDAYDAEKQLTKALKKMAKAAASDGLRSAFESHLPKAGLIGGTKQVDLIVRPNPVATMPVSVGSVVKEFLSDGDAVIGILDGASDG